MSHLEMFITQESMCTNGASVCSVTWFKYPEVSLLLAHGKTRFHSSRSQSEKIKLSFLVSSIKSFHLKCSWERLHRNISQLILPKEEQNPSCSFYPLLFSFLWETLLREQDIRCPMWQRILFRFLVSYPVVFNGWVCFSCMIGIITLTRQRTGTGVLPNW